MKMSVLNSHTDHYKEYFFKISANRAKLFYKRTATGHKKIAKKEIPPHLVESIKEYDEEKDKDWMKYVSGLQTEIDELTEKLRLLPTWNLPQATEEKSKKIFEARLEVRKKMLPQYEKYNEEAAEERYREEMDKYGGFDGYFKAKYNNFNYRTPKFTMDDYEKFFGTSSSASDYEKFFGTSSSASDYEKFFGTSSSTSESGKFFGTSSSTSESGKNEYTTPPKEKQRDTPKDEYKSSPPKDEYKPSPFYHKTDFSTLIRLGIITSSSTPKEEAKRKYRRWLVENHPDKGGDSEICKVVISQYEDFCAR